MFAAAPPSESPWWPAAGQEEMGLATAFWSSPLLFRACNDNINDITAIITSRQFDDNLTPARTVDAGALRFGRRASHLNRATHHIQCGERVSKGRCIDILLQDVSAAMASSATTLHYRFRTAIHNRVRTTVPACSWE
jgi:hypothetical protein